MSVFCLLDFHLCMKTLRSLHNSISSGSSSSHRLSKSDYSPIHNWCTLWLWSPHSPHSSQSNAACHNQSHLSRLPLSIRKRNICTSLNVGASPIVSPSPTVPQWPICYWRGHTSYWVWKPLHLRPSFQPHYSRGSPSASLVLATQVSGLMYIQRYPMAT